MYTNANTLKKYIEMFNKKQIDEKLVTLPIKPMYKIVALNPQMTVGITGLRCIQKGGFGLSMWPIVYIKKEHVSYSILLC